jgi:hypothetical protein
MYFDVDESEDLFDLDYRPAISIYPDEADTAEYRVADDVGREPICPLSIQVSARATLIRFAS